MSDSEDGNYKEVASGVGLKVPNDAVGKYIKVISTDKKGATSTSIPYKVLSDIPVGDLNANITRIEIARMLAKMWDLTAPKQNVEIKDIDKNNPEYNMVAAIVEKGMMPLADGNFNPNGTITRQEMASIAMMSCGVSYKNASTIYDSTFDDGKEIGATYLTNVERSKQFGFMVGTKAGIFSPKKVVTYAEAIAIMDRVSDFAGK